MYKMIKREKFHHMNATVETVQFDDGMTVQRLVSYDSVVCDIDREAGTIFLYPRFQYSPTTIRQVTRFLNEYMPLVDERWNIGLIRYVREQSDSGGCTSLYKYGIFAHEYVIGTTRRW